jgi:hypothetical protein
MFDNDAIPDLRNHDGARVLIPPVIYTWGNESNVFMGQLETPLVSYKHNHNIKDRIVNSKLSNN